MRKPVKTSYFGRLRALDLSLYYLVQVCRHAPKGVTCDTVLVPALPGWQSLVVPLKEGLITEAEYERSYLRVLDSKREELLEAVREILKAAGERTPLLLCYEKPSDWCHRHVLAGWLRKEGFDVNEL